MSAYNLTNTASSAQTIQSLNTTGNALVWNSLVEIGNTALTANATITLPTTSTPDIGKSITFKRIDGANFTVTLASANTLETTTPTALNSQYGSLTITCVSATKAEQVNNIGQVVMADYVEVATSGTFSAVGSSDHAQFNVLIRQIGTSITPDISTTYNTANNVNSLGRFLLQPGKTYELEGDVGDIGGAASSYINYNWVNADTGVVLTTGVGGANIIGANLSSTNSGRLTAKTTFTPLVATRVELRFNTTNGVTSYGGAFASNKARACIQVISGFVPVTGQSVDTISVNLTGSNFSIPAVNTDVIFNTLAFGNIPYNTSTGVFTLISGKTYELEATLKSRSTAGGYIQYEWVDGVSGVVITGGINGVDMQVTSLLNEGSSARAYLLYTPNTNQTVKVRVTGISGTSVQLDAQRCNANIKQIGTSAFVANTWLSYTPSITATVNPTLPTTNILNAMYMVVGKVMFINFNLSYASQTGLANGTGTYNFSIPSGFTIDTTKALIPSAIGATTDAGYDGTGIGTFLVSNNASNYTGKVVALTSTTLGLFGTTFSGGNRGLRGSANGQFGEGTSPSTYSFTAQIPIN